MDSPTTYISKVGYDRIQVIQGHESVVYGASGSGGTILFTREDPDFSNVGNARYYSGLMGKANLGYIGNSGVKTMSMDVTAGSEQG